MRFGKMNKKATVLTSGLVLLALVGSSVALIENTSIEDQIVDGDRVRDVSIEDSGVSHVLLRRASVEGSSIESAFVEHVSVEESYIRHVTLRHAFVEDSRIKHAEIDASSLEDTTVCNVSVNNLRGFGDCHSISVEDGQIDVHAVLGKDAPDTVRPGDSYEIQVQDSDASQLVVENDPGGLVGLGFETEEDPLGLQELGFQATASNESIDTIEIWQDGEMMSEFGLGEEVELPDGAFTLRVHTAETGIIDHSRIALVLNLDGHTLRPAMTSFDVVATDLAIPPLEGQLFAPFLADDVARLVLSVPIDEHGNVDRDVNVSFEVEVNSVNATDAELMGDLQDHARLHDDSRLFSEAPFSYRQQVDAAHHPQTLELLVRENLIAELPHGAINAYGTHLVAIGPYETDVTLTASGTNTEGDSLNATIDIVMGATPEEERTATFFGEDFELPGRGNLRVELVDEEGDPVNAGSDWSLFIRETPDSHGVSQSIAIDEGTTVVNQDLPASKQLATPLGNFVPSEYEVCVDHDAGRTCAEGGELVPIVTGETSTVEVMVE